MKVKKLLTVIMAVISLLSFAPNLWAFEYKDVPQGSPYYYSVDYLRRNDVFKDTAYFHPDALITRAEFIKYLVLLNSPDFVAPKNVKLPFGDTRDGAWYAPYFKRAIDLGILDSRDPKAQPDVTLTLIDALTLLFHSQSIPIPNVYKGTIPYTDVSKNTQAAPLIMRALSLNIIQPQKSDYVGIYQRVSRAQAAMMIYKMDLVTLGGPTSNGLPDISTHTPELDKIISVWDLIESTYLKRDTVDKSTLADDVLKTLVSKLGDPYSVYMDAKENANFEDSLGGQVEGIGAVIGYNDEKKVVIVSPIKGSPAEKAGLLAKDIITQVNDADITGKTLEEVVALIKGPKGTTVKIQVQREDGSHVFTITRELIDIPAVTYQTVDNGRVMDITLSQFNTKAVEEFLKAVQAVKADGNIKGIILDLRGDPGGLLDVAVTILGHFVEAQKDLVTIQYVDFSQVLLSNGPADLGTMPLAVLIDGGSASAAEIVAGALQDYKLGTVIGEKSFGKGTVQEVNYFLDTSSLKLTVAKWLTPNRQSIQDGGIQPDIVIAKDDNSTVDAPLQKAIEVLDKTIH